MKWLLLSLLIEPIARAAWIAWRVRKGQWSRWIENVRGEQVLKINHIYHLLDRRVDLHAILRPDIARQYHSHPAWAVRIVLWGGYVEELENGTLIEWRPGRIGVVSPQLVHRIAALRSGPSFTLWFRGKIRWPVFLRGEGWPKRWRDTRAEKPKGY